MCIVSISVSLFYVCVSAAANYVICSASLGVGGQSWTAVSKSGCVSHRLQRLPEMPQVRLSEGIRRVLCLP